MGLKQSTVSHQLKNLEKALNVTLFLRRHKELEITSAGEALYDKAIALFEHVQTVMDSIGRKEGELKGMVRLATTHAIAMFFLTKTLQEFYARHPEVRFAINGGGFGQIIEAVTEGSADFGIVSLGEFADHMVYRPLFGSRLVLISPKGNPFGLPDRPSLEDIARVPFISFPPRGTVDTTIKALLQSRHLEMQAVITTNTFSLLLKYVRAGLGVTMLDMFTVHDDECLYDIYEIADALPDRQYVMIWRKNKRFSDQVEAFMDHIYTSPAPKGCTSLSRF